MSIKKDGNRILLVRYRPNNYWVYLGALLLIVAASLPLIKATPFAIRNGIPIVGSVFIILGFLKGDVSFFKRFLLEFVIIAVCNGYYYYQVMQYYVSASSFLYNFTQCWMFVFLATYYASNSDKETEKKLFYLFVLITIITAISSIIEMQEYPEVVRNLSNNMVWIGDRAQYFYLHNVATWSDLYSAVFLLPTLIHIFKQTHRPVWIILIVVIEVFVLMSQVMMGILLSVIFLLFIFIDPPKPSRAIVILIVSVILYVLLREFIGDLLLGIYNATESVEGFDLTRRRILAFYRIITAQQALSGTFERTTLYMTSLSTFLRNPIIGFHDTGAYKMYISMHSQMLDLFASTGLFGTIPIIYVGLKNMSRTYRRNDSSDGKRYVFLIFCLFVLLSFLNLVYYSTSLFLSVFLIPVLSQGICNAEIANEAS